MSESSETTANTSLSVRGLRKTYSGVVAIKNIGFKLRTSEIHGLCGENGAGKSTLVKVLEGLPLRLKETSSVPTGASKA
uniref:ATP-binding cassette domain-containing protein n=2 Tax=unclassified Rhizobium TaxID=2613769 RepID=UPI001AAF6B3C|nr:ATP-binding cassette domain-containing protein [Rhizobium sp. T1473]MCA0804504.1 ATP-binding cassette domain-containing protein [Rhizobium sp. T1473]